MQIRHAQLCVMNCVIFDEAIRAEEGGEETDFARLKGRILAVFFTGSYRTEFPFTFAPPKMNRYWATCDVPGELKMLFT